MSNENIKINTIVKSVCVNNVRRLHIRGSVVLKVNKELTLSPALVRVHSYDNNIPLMEFAPYDKGLIVDEEECEVITPEDFEVFISSKNNKKVNENDLIKVVENSFGGGLPPQEGVLDDLDI